MMLRTRLNNKPKKWEELFVTMLLWLKNLRKMQNCTLTILLKLLINRLRFWMVLVIRLNSMLMKFQIMLWKKLIPWALSLTNKEKSWLIITKKLRLNLMLFLKTLTNKVKELMPRLKSLKQDLMLLKMRLLFKLRNL
ncbi:MAG: hypothetical protein BWY78_01241 [Alphaproteobacteria bacterium ADurb.Bin438]|nr:MAG: hypothetical protein BWY78_01241 [Alphaproteobacteria bacterium ADurb.Bin438]